MIQRGDAIGVHWNERISNYEKDLDELQRTYERLVAKDVKYPSYYLMPFHAYDEGNLSWQAAMEVESAALTVHAQIFNKEKDELDAHGDFTLRNNYHKNMLYLLNNKRPGGMPFSPKRILVSLSRL